MNIESKARAGFTSIMLRGGRMTKWKGQVASYAPQVGHLQSVSVAAMAAALAFGGAMAVPSEAQAQDVTVVVDSGAPAPAIQQVNNGNGSLIIDANVPVVGATIGIDATNGPSADDLVIDATDVTGGNDGIVATNNGSGQTSITTTGVVTGTGNSGIDVTTLGNGLLINVNQVNGTYRGIDAVNNGSGVTTITATGTITSTFYDGVSVETGGSTGDINVDVAAVNSGKAGVTVTRTGGGTGDINVNAGSITSRSEENVATYGIQVSIESDSADGNIAINATNITADSGIVTENFGYGSTTIVSTGTIATTNGPGVSAIQAGAGSDINIDVNNVTAINDAIVANNFGGGDVNIVIRGAITGGEDGVAAFTNGSGSLTITSSGPIIGGGTGNGISVVIGKPNTIPPPIVAASASMSGGFGILANKPVQRIEVGDVTAPFNGLLVENQGTGDTVIISTGTIKGDGADGINVLNDVDAIDLSLDVNNVQGLDNGINATNNGIGFTTVVARGLVTGAGDAGVIVTSAGSGISIDVNEVRGDDFGIVADNTGSGVIDILARGNVAGGDVDGIKVTAGANVDDITIDVANVTGATHGIFVDSSSTGGNVKITSSGTVTSIDGENGSTIGLQVNMLSAASTGNIEMDLANVEGASGIKTTNSGEGSTTIAATGTINARYGFGINALQDGAGSGIAINVNDVTAADEGILANLSSGTGDLIITAANVDTNLVGISAINSGSGGVTDITISESVESVSAVAISVVNGTDTTGLKITGTDAAGTISGTSGISAIHNGSGSAVIDIAGDVVGKTVDAINVQNGANALNLFVSVKDATALDDGLELTNNGSGITTAISKGQILAGDFGISVKNGANTTGLVIEANGIAARGVGIYADNKGTNDTIISATGTVSSVTSEGILALNDGSTGSLTISAVDVRGSKDSVKATNDGTGFTSITLAGTVTGGANNDGINVTNAASAKNLTINATKPAVADAAGVVAATISGGVNGILAVNNGVGGSTTVTAAGKTVGTTGDGINVTNGPGTIDLTVLAGSVEGGVNGIFADNSGNGSTTVTATGPVVGTAGVGVSAKNNFVTSDNVTVDVAAVTGGTIGIDVLNNGSGTTLVKATGLVSGSDGEGILVDSNGTSVTIEAADVSGTLDAIKVTNDGSDFTLITLSGNATGGTNNDGINVTNAASAKSLTINAANAATTITGGVNGILAVNNGVGGSTTVTAAGKTVGTTGDGINVTNGAGTTGLTVVAGTVEGGQDGIEAVNNGGVGGGVTSVTATGLVEGAVNGIIASNSVGATDVSVSAAAVSGGVAGIIATNTGNGSTTVIATGPVDGATGVGISARNEFVTTDNLTVDARNSVTGGTIGIDALNNGNGFTLVKATGLVDGSDGEGILVVSNGTSLTIEAADVSGTLDAIKATNNGSDFTLITLSGNATGGANNDGINVTNAASAKSLTINAANAATTITGGVNGILAVNNGVGGSTTVTAAGKTVGTTGDGINVTNGAGTTGLTILAGSVEGGQDGIEAVNNGGGVTSVTATGLVEGAVNGIIASNDPGATDVSVSAAAVSGGVAGIIATNTGNGSTTVIATGPVDGATGVGISAKNNLVFTNDVTVDVAAVTGGTIGIDVLNNGSGTTLVKATGLVSGSDGEGILVDSNGTSVTIEATDVSGTLDAIKATNNGSGFTSITLSGNATGGTNNDGINVTNGASAKDLTINSTKLAVADAAGVVAATISGGVNGILAINNGVGGSTSITAAGKAVGGTGDGINVTNGADTVNLTVLAGSVEGGDDGIEVLNNGTGFTLIKSTGLISGLDAFGIFAVNNGSSLTIDVADVSGNANGINATNSGTSFTLIKTSGTVATGGDNRTGINALNNETSSDLTIESTALSVAGAATVLGQLNGISAENNGSGSTTISVAGLVKAVERFGIDVDNGEFADNLSVTANDIVAEEIGIVATNNGTGTTTIVTTGLVSSNNSSGISVKNGEFATDVFVTSNNIEGDATALFARNYGTGISTVTVNGSVNSVTGDAVNVKNFEKTRGLTVTATNAAATIIGDVDGIEVENGGSGSTSVTALGKTVGATEDGIKVTNGAGTFNLNITANIVEAQDTGILAENEGTGSTLVISTGSVLGVNFDGINVEIEENASDLEVNANNVTGGRYGIATINDGKGVNIVRATGLVKGLSAAGISLYSGPLSSSLIVSANNVEGFEEGIEAYNYGTGSTSITVSGNVTGGVDDNGIDALNAVATTKDLTINATGAAATVQGGVNGILAVNNGIGGSTSVASLGTVLGRSASGIDATNEVDTLNLTVAANNVQGATNGVAALNKGKGNTTVSLTGNATGGTTGFGLAVTNAASAKDLTINASGAAAKIVGGLDGILAVNNGVGSTSITTKGDVAGTTRTGINARNAATTVDLKVDANNVSGAEFGVVAINAGKGSNSVTVSGNAVGTTKSGIKVYNAATATDLTLSASNATGALFGIDALNEGTGATKVTSTGSVTGGDIGLSLNNGVKSGNLAVSVNNATGGNDGLNAQNNGTGSTAILATGTVVGTARVGLFVENAATATDLTLAVNNVTGGTDGLVAFNGGKGATTLDAKGDIKGVRDGVQVANAATASTLTVSVKNVTGGIDGLDVINDGTGASTVSISGKVSGGTGVGVATTSKAGKLTTINLAATADVSATSGNAITNNLGDSVLNVANGAVITGTVRLGDGSDTANILLSSTAAFAGITELDGGDNFAAADGFVDTLNLNGAGSFDLVGARVTNWELINFNAGTVGFSDALITAGALNVNNGATLNAANSLVATANVNVASNGTLLVGNVSGNSNARIVGNLTSAGLVNLSGTVGKAGDKLNVTANFTGANGRVRLDTVLNGDNSPTDTLNIAGNAIGSTLIAVTNVGGTGGLTLGDGIKLVQVGGKSDQTAFRLLDENVQSGGFRYGLFLGGIADPNDQDWYLRTVGASDIAATTVSFARLSDDIAMTFLGTLHERVGEQEHLAKRGYQNSGIGGLWGRFVGKGFRERLSSATLGDIKSTGSISGLQMGLDFGRTIKSDGSATFTGAYAGYADGSSSDQNIFRNIARRSGASSGKGWLTGLYATHYGSTGWYANAVVQATWVDASASARNGLTLETDGRTYLGSVELGKSLKLGNRLAFETQAQLIYGETRFDDARDSVGMANKIRIEDSLTGRVGFRLKTTKDEKYNAAGGLFSGYLKANLWHNLLGSDVRLNTAGIDLGKFEPKKTWVDAGLGTTLTMSQNTELFFDADVEFGIDQKTTAGTGKVGLRINW